jgi:hypothetical protein
MPFVTARVPSHEENFGWWLQKRPCPPNEPGAPTINLWIKSAANVCKLKRIPAEKAVELIRANMTRPEKFPREVERTVERTYAQDLGSIPVAEPALVFKPAELDFIAWEVTEDIDDDWLIRHSPCPVDIAPSDYLDAIGYIGDKYCISHASNDRGFIYPVGDSKVAARLNNYVRANQDGAWLMAQAVNGKPINGSLRSAANVAEFRFVLLESDVAREYEWLRFLAQLDRPIVSIQRSGNKSIHAVIRVDVETSTEFDQLVAEFKRSYVPLGACSNSIRAVQQIRLPNVVRNDKGTLQRLLWLNAEASGSSNLSHVKTKRPAF